MRLSDIDPQPPPHATPIQIIHDIIEASPRVRYENGTNPFGCTEIDLRRFATAGSVLQFDQPLVIPGNRSVQLWGGPGHSQTLLRYTGKGPAIIVEGGHRIAHIRGVTLSGGGIRYEAKTNAHWGVADSTITGAEVAIEVAGKSCVSGVFDNVQFRNNDVNVSLQYEQSNLFRFSWCKFLQTLSYDAGVQIACSDVSFHDCMFERARGFAHVWLKARDPDAAPERIARSILFDNCRWGPELFSSYEPRVPDYIFQVGNDEPSGDVIYGIICRSASFSRGASTAVILQNCPMKNCEFSQRNNCTIPTFVDAQYPERWRSKNAHNRILGDPPSLSGLDNWSLI